MQEAPGISCILQCVFDDFDGFHAFYNVFFDDFNGAAVMELQQWSCSNGWRWTTGGAVGGRKDRASSLQIDYFKNRLDLGDLFLATDG